jgi:protease-4
MTKSAKWFIGILATLFVLFAVLSILFISFIQFSPEETEVVTDGSGERVGLVEVFGPITGSERVVRQLKEYREDPSIRAILLHIDSPGGGVVASQEIYHEVRKTREQGKVVVAAMGSLAASGGYYIACGASRIVANDGTLTGSIGVIAEFLQLSDALGKLGISVRTVKSGRLKDAGSPVKPMTGEEERYFQDLMDQVHRQFIAVVEKERGLTHEEVVDVADGRVFTGENATELGLVDTLGTFEDAIAITADLAGIEGVPALVREERRRYWWRLFFAEAAESLSEIKQEILDRPVLSYRFVGP